jgi:hypothetical protein
MNIPHTEYAELMLSACEYLCYTLSHNNRCKLLLENISLYFVVQPGQEDQVVEGRAV